MNGLPALTRAEFKAFRADREAHRHWTGFGCWCDGTGEALEHGTTELVPPPWQRDKGRAT